MVSLSTSCLPPFATGKMISAVGFFRRRRSPVLFVLALIMTCGCGGSGESASPPAGGGTGGPPPTNVRAYQVIPQAIEETIQLVGTLTARERVDIKSEVTGVVTSHHFQEGDHVEKGALLFEINREERAAELEEAQANAELARINFERSKTLAANRTIPQQELDRAAASLRAAEATVRLREKRLADASVRAPFSGRLGARMVSGGQFVTAGHVLTTLVDADPVHLDFNVPERYFNELALGQRISLQVVANPGESFAGEVFFISPEVDTATRTILMRARIPNPEERLKPGMFGNVNLVVREDTKTLLIPEEAIMRRGPQSVVAIVNSGGRAEFRPVQLGRRMDGMVEITRGLEENDRVVTEGHQKFGPGMPLNITVLVNESAVSGETGKQG